MQTLISTKVQTNFGKAIDIGKEGSELTRLRDLARLNDYFAAQQDKASQGAPELSMEDICMPVHELRI